MIEALKQSLDNLRTNKLRSCLTMFGIMWGVISIVILSAMGEGFQRGNQAVLEELGKNIVVIRNGRTSVQAGGERAGRVIRLNINDVYELRGKSRLIQYLSPELMRGGVSIKSAYNAASLQISGIWPDFQSIRTIELSEKAVEEAPRFHSIPTSGLSMICFISKTEIIGSTRMKMKNNMTNSPIVPRKVEISQMVG